MLAPRVQQAGQTSFRTEQELQDRVAQAWQAAAEIRVFGLADAFAADLRTSRRERAEASARAAVMGHAPQYVMEIALIAGLGLVSLFAVAIGRGVLGADGRGRLGCGLAATLAESAAAAERATTVRHNRVWADQGARRVAGPGCAHRR